MQCVDHLNMQISDQLSYLVVEMRETSQAIHLCCKLVIFLLTFRLFEEKFVDKIIIIVNGLDVKDIDFSDSIPTTTV